MEYIIDILIKSLIDKELIISYHKYQSGKNVQIRLFNNTIINIGTIILKDGDYIHQANRIKN